MLYSEGKCLSSGMVVAAPDADSSLPRVPSSPALLPYPPPLPSACLRSSSYANANKLPQHACSCLSMHKTLKFVKKSVHTKFSSKKQQLDCSREPKGKQKESLFTDSAKVGAQTSVP